MSLAFRGERSTESVRCALLGPDGLHMRSMAMATPWHDDDLFWQVFRPALFSERAFEAARQDVAELLALTAAPPAAAVLDLCCGPGRHSLELARRGFTVTGVDRTEAYLAEARRRAEEEGLTIELLRADMRQFVRERSFDLAINLFTSFSYFANPGEDRQVAENLYRSLKPGGVLVIELMGREVLARIFQRRDWQPLDDGGFLLQENEVTEHWSWIRSRWILVRAGTTHEQIVQHRLYTATDLAALLRSVGFTDVGLHGSLAGDPYDHQAKRLVAVARKPLAEQQEHIAV